MLRVIVAGSRNFTDYRLLSRELDNLLGGRTDIEIVSGTACGADQMGERWAAERAIKVHRYPADWDRLGRSAGYRRNETMANNAEMLVAFWDGQSRGTMHMINLAKQKGLRVEVVRV